MPPNPPSFSVLMHTVQFHSDSKWLDHIQNASSGLMSRNVHWNMDHYFPIDFYYRLIGLAPNSIYKHCTSYLQALCSNHYLGYRRILNKAHQM